MAWEQIRVSDLCCKSDLFIFHVSFKTPRDLWGKWSFCALAIDLKLLVFCHFTTSHWNALFFCVLWNQGNYQVFTIFPHASHICLFHLADKPLPHVCFSHKLWERLCKQYSQVAVTCRAKNNFFQSRRLWGRWTKQSSYILNHYSFSNQCTSNTSTGPDRGEAEQTIALSAGIHRYDVYRKYVSDYLLGAHQPPTTANRYKLSTYFKQHTHTQCSLQTLTSLFRFLLFVIIHM